MLDLAAEDIEFYGIADLNAVVAAARRESLKPPPILKISEWAKAFGQLSPETSASTGDFEAFPYQNGLMDSFCDPTVAQTTVMKSARVGFTKVLDMVIGYYLHQDPSPILAVQPRVEDAEDYSKTEITPMIRDTPVLAALGGDAKGKDSGNTILKKTFINGSSLSFVGANSPGGFRRITVRVALFDEVDGYPIDGAGNEGDQVKLGSKRTLTFWNRIIGLGSTPTLKDFSRIEREWSKSDQRYFYVPCPQCGEKQRLEWGGKDQPFGFKWDLDPETGEGIPESVYYLCRHNACVIRESDKKAMVEAGEWVATKPFKGHAGFHIWTAYSFFPNASWDNIVREWLECKSDPLARQTFFNLVLGLPYEDSGESSIRKEDILERCHDWIGEVPNEGCVVTCGVDVQDYRVEMEVVAWDQREESWSVEYFILDGQFSDPMVQEELDQFLLKKWKKADGTLYPIAATCIDSGGHHTQAVYNFCKTRLGRKVFAIKGEAAIGGKRSPVWPTVKPTKRKKKAFRPVIIGVNAAKDAIRSRLLLEKHGPGYMHFPTDRNEGYFAQLTSERLVPKIVNGFKYRVWELLPGRANEALDCRVYAYAALCSLSQFGYRPGTRIATGALPPKAEATAGSAPFRPGQVKAQGSTAGPPQRVSATVESTAGKSPSGRLSRRLA